MNPLSHTSVLVNKDEEHLRLLGIYHLLMAALNTVGLVLFTLLPLLIGPSYFTMMQLPPSPPERLMLGLFFLGLISAVYAFNGWSLKHKRHWLSCVILSCIECLTSLPLGMILGVSAVLVLRRPSVRELFRQTHTQTQTTG